MNIQQVSGSVTGDMGKESILLGDYALPNQVIGMATKEEVPVLKHVAWDGIVGLAQPTARLKAQGIRPLIDNLEFQGFFKKRQEAMQFTWFLGYQKGSLIMGGADLRQKRSTDEEFVWTPISKEEQWTITVRDVRAEKRNLKNYRFKQLGDIDDLGDLDEREGSSVEEKEQPAEQRQSDCADGCETIVDTGTYLTQGPKAQVNKIFQGVTMKTCDDMKSMPNIIFEVDGHSKGGRSTLVQLTLEPEDYVLQFKYQGKTDCVVGIYPENFSFLQGWTLGQINLRPFYTVFDRAGDQIGWVRANGDPKPAPGAGDDSRIPNSQQKDLHRFKQLIRDKIRNRSR